MADDQTLTAGGKKKPLIFRINLSMRGSGLIICQERVVTWQMNPFISSSHVPFMKASRQTNQQDLGSFVVSCVKKCEETVGISYAASWKHMEVMACHTHVHALWTLDLFWPLFYLPLRQNQYKADYADFMKGIGWLPLGSLEAEKNKKAMEIISEKKYRQHPDTLKYSTLMDSMNMVLAQNNAKIMNDVSLAVEKLAWLGTSD